MPLLSRVNHFQHINCFANRDMPDGLPQTGIRSTLTARRCPAHCSRPRDRIVLPNHWYSPLQLQTLLQPFALTVLADINPTRVFARII